MTTVLKYLLYFTISFLILSIPIANKKLFHHIDHVAAPYSKIILIKSKAVLITGKKFIIKFFTNSSNKNVDHVKTRFSANKKKEKVYRSYTEDKQRNLEHSYTHEEEQLLKKVLLEN